MIGFFTLFWKKRKEFDLNIMKRIKITVQIIFDFDELNSEIQIIIN